MTPLELAAILITAATSLKDEGMELEIDPSANFMDLATLVAIAYAENEQGENIGSGQSTLKDEEGKREVSFGPFQINKFWYRDKSKSGDTTVVNNEYTSRPTYSEPYHCLSYHSGTHGIGSSSMVLCFNTSLSIKSITFFS